MSVGGASAPLRFRLGANPLSVTQARRYVRAYLGFAPPVAKQVELALSEAVGNAVTHAYGGGDGEIEVVLSMKREVVEVVVRDVGIGPVNDSETAGFGFGLVLMKALSERFEIGGSPSTGTTVRMEFRLAAEA